jgi:large subunit ribosomal protein L29
MKAKDMREKSLEDLKELEKSIYKDAFQARFKNFTARLDDTSSLKKARRDIARVKTIITERALAEKIDGANEGAPAKTAAPAPKTTKKAAAGAAKKAGDAAAKAQPKAKTTKKKTSEATP